MKTFILFAFLALAITSRADSDECNSDVLVDYVANNHNNGLLTLLCYIDEVQTGSGSDSIQLSHFVHVIFQNSPASLNGLGIDTYFKDAAGDAIDIPYTIDQSGVYTLVLNFDHDTFLSFDCDLYHDGGFLYTHDCTFSIDFLNECQDNVVKTFTFRYKVKEDRSIQGQVSLLSNQLFEDNDDCDLCVSEISYSAAITIYTDNSYASVWASPEYDLGDMVYLEFAAQEDVPHKILIDSIKELLPNGSFEEMIDHAETVTIPLSGATTQIGVKVLVPADFTLIISGHIDPNARLLEETKANEPKFHAAAKVSVDDKETASAATAFCSALTLISFLLF